MAAATPLVRPRWTARTTCPSQMRSNEFPPSRTGQVTEIRSAWLTGRNFVSGMKIPLLLRSTARARARCSLPFSSTQDNRTGNFKGNRNEWRRSAPMAVFPKKGNFGGSDTILRIRLPVSSAFLGR